MTNILNALRLPFSLKGNGGPWGPKDTRDAPRAPSKKNPQNAGNGNDLDDMLRQAQDRMRDMMGSGGNKNRRPASGGNGGNGGDIGTQGIITLAILGGLAIWVYQSFYIVQPDEQGVVTRFGKYVETTNEGLHFHLWPVEQVVKPQVTRENIIEIGFRSSQSSSALSNRFAARASSNNSRIADVPAESLMLTGDENIVDLDFTVRWKIENPEKFLFNVAQPEDTLKHIAESAMREIVGRYPIDAAITEDKDTIQRDATALIQKIAEGYGLGVQINGVELQQVLPPKEVLDAFRDVQAAKADAEKVKNQATGYANDIVPRARGEVSQIMQDAEGYKASKVAEATGNAERFASQLTEYRKAKEITKQRLYIETMEEVLKGNKKVILSKDAGQSVLPYLPLNKNGSVK